MEAQQSGAGDHADELAHMQGQHDKSLTRVPYVACVVMVVVEESSVRISATIALVDAHLLHCFSTAPGVLSRHARAC